jgi:hypothetical protein
MGRMALRFLPKHKLAALIDLALALLALYSATRIGVLLTSGGYGVGDAIMAGLLVLAEL